MIFSNQLSPKSNGIVFFLIFFLPQFLFAFANNNVRVDKFKWEQAQTEHFDIYYDKESEAMVPRLAHHLENAWKEVGDRVDVQVEEKIPFFFYSNHNQFEQTNIVPIGEGTGGVTEAFKNRFTVYNDGSEAWLKHVIYHEFTHVCQFNVLYGGFWKSIRLLKSPFYPLWVMEGMAEYGSGDIDEAAGDLVVRDAVANSQLIGLPELQGFAHLKPNQITLGYKTGEAAIHFLADEYGPDKVGKLLKIIEGHFDVSSALEQMLGLDIYRFDFRFQEWLQEKYADFFKTAKPPTFYGTQLTFSDQIPQFNESPVVTKDGSKIYYFSDKGGPTQIYEYDAHKKKEKPLIALSWSYENIHSHGRALSLSSDERWLALAGEKKQKDFLFLFDLKKKKLKKVKIPFDQIRFPVFSPTGDFLVCVGMEKGLNDLYFIDTEGKILKRLTNNPWDERDPVFSADGTKVVFTQEILSSDLSTPLGRDLFLYDTTSALVSRLSHLKGYAQDPEILPDGSILFVRDRNDAGQLGFNLYQLTFSGEKKVTQLTNFIGGGFSPRYLASQKKLVYVAFHAGEKHLYDFPLVLDGEKPVPAQMKETIAKEGPLVSNDNEVPPVFNRWGEALLPPLVLGPGKPYRFRASTDLFLPFFFYSSLDGFVLANIWQASDYFGNHQFQQQLQYASGDDLLDVAVAYSYSRFRPDVTLSTRKQTYYTDVNQLDQRRESNTALMVSYPLDRITSVSAGVGVNDRDEDFVTDPTEERHVRDRYALLSFSIDTISGRYLVPTKGDSLSLFYQQGFETASGNQEYKTGGVQGVHYTPLDRESTFVSRGLYARSVGRDSHVFRLGGLDRLRGLGRNSQRSRNSNLALLNNEVRFRMKYLNARTKFLFPDFFFKAAYLLAFDDVGFSWDTPEERQKAQLNDLTHSVGGGISFPTFIIQSFKIDLTFLYAVDTTRGSRLFYISIGPTF